MFKSTLLQKLEMHLSVPVRTECEVVYLVSGIRKLLERDQPDPKPFALWMYCHWALHINLTNSKTTLHFLKTIDNFILKTVAGYQDAGSFSFLDEHHLFREFVYLDTFRKQLGELLKVYKLPTQLCDDDERWFSFVAAYAEVIEDGTLSATTSKTAQLQAVASVTMTKGPALSSDNHIPFTIRWDVVLMDGRVLRIDVDAMPKLNMLSHHLAILPTF